MLTGLISLHLESLRTENTGVAAGAGTLRDACRNCAGFMLANAVRSNASLTFIFVSRIRTGLFLFQL